MSILFKISMIQSKSQSHHSPFPKFDEFLAETIHSQLVNFHTTRYFMSQSYLIKMFLFSNEENLQLLYMVLIAEICNDFFKYMNLLMAEVYKVFFQNKLPKVLPEMKETLHVSPNRKIGVWFMLEEHTIIRVYGFTHEPYIFLAVLTPRVFSWNL